MNNSAIDEIELNSDLGQVWTPADIASKMIDEISKYCNHKSRVLDPASGPGTFYSAFLQKKLNFSSFDCFEIDQRLCDYMSTNFKSTNLYIHCSDFFDKCKEKSNYDLAILNPPYVRHENISQYEKEKLQKLINSHNPIEFTKRMNYFGYFLIEVASQLKNGGVMCAIVYDSLDSTQYGQEIVRYLASIGRFITRETISAPFKNRLIDAEIMLWKKNDISEERNIQVDDEKLLSFAKNYCPISELASVKRGTSFVKREYFVVAEPNRGSSFIEMVTKQPPSIGLKVKANAFGLFESGTSDQDEIQLNILKQAIKDPKIISLKSLPKPVVGDIIFNYYLRDNPRHLLNVLRIPASDNFYCLKISNQRNVLPHWVMANSIQSKNRLIESSRKQGSGLRKLQLFEYLRCGFPDYRNFSDFELDRFTELGSDAVLGNWGLDQLSTESTKLLIDLGFPVNE